MLARLTHGTIRLLDRLLVHTAAWQNVPSHQRTGRLGEEEAYFYLRKLGYVMVARNYRSSRRRGEVDLIGWEGEVLCFIAVKTRTTHDVKPAEAAVISTSSVNSAAWRASTCDICGFPNVEIRRA